MEIYVVALSLSVGAAVLGLWSMLVVRRQVPELKAGSPSIRFHIAAEVGMALFLLAGGIALIADLSWGTPMAAAALGAALYSTVNSPGYYADKHFWPVVIMFLVLAVLVAIGIGWLVAAA